jgi:phage shock protein PspC (stress-responsive transcriptional regulator)
VVGGVCAGIAAYFGIADPLWVRIAFIIFTISGGFGIPAYLILWVILPRAESASDRLSMRGEPINVSNIGKIIEEEIGHISDKVSELGNELSGKKKGLSASGTLGSALRQGMNLIGQVVHVLIDIIRKIWKPFIIIIGGGLILFSAFSWISTVVGLLFAWPLLEFFMPDRPLLAMLGAFNVLAIIGMLMLALVLFVTRLLYGTRMGSPWRTGLMAFWILNVVSFFLVASLTAREFSHGTSSDIEMVLNEVTSDVLTVKLAPRIQEDNWFSMDDEMRLVSDGLATNEVHIVLEKASSDVFEMTVVKAARGRDANQAKQRANAISFHPEIVNNELILPYEIIIPKGEKWRVQDVDVILKIPVGKSVTFAEDTQYRVQRAFKANDDVMIWYNPGHVWTMTDEGLICPTCPQEESEDYNETSKLSTTYSGFNKVYVEGLIKVYASQGNDFEVELDGEEQYTNQVSIDVQDNELRVITDLESTSSPLRLYITMPELVAFHSEGTEDVRLQDFHGERLEVNVQGKYELKADVRVDSLYLIQEGPQKVDLRGQYSFLNAELSNEARLDGEKAAISSAQIKAQNNSRIELGSIPQLTQEIDESSKIDLDF